MPIFALGRKAIFVSREGLEKDKMISQEVKKKCWTVPERTQRRGWTQRDLTGKSAELGRKYPWDDGEHYTRL